MFAIKAAVLLVFLNLATNAGGIIPINRPDSDIYYSFQRELYLRGGVDNPLVIISPTIDNIYKYKNSEYEYLIEPLNKLNSKYLVEKNKLDLSISIAPHTNITEDNTKKYLALSPYLKYGFSDNFLLEVSYWIDGALADDQRYQGKKWDNFAGYPDLAVISYYSDKLRLDIGRRRSRWGMSSGGNTLFLSSSAMPMDGLFLDYNFNKYLSFHLITAYLSPLRDASPFSDVEQTENRYFSAHALRISPYSWWDIILKESVIYGGFGRRLEPAYMFPAIWYHAEQLNENVDDNTFFGFETIVRLQNRFAGYLEILLDDIQIENSTEFDNEPTEYGLIIGADIFDWPLKQGTLELQYTRINNYTFNQMKPRNVYINQNYPIGHPRGPDHESYELSYTYHLSSEYTLILKGLVINNGEGTLGEPWTEPWLDNPDYLNKFPSGVVENRFEGQIDFYYVKNDWFMSKLSAKVADINNDKNISAGNQTDWSINIQIMVYLPNLSWRFSDE